MAVTLILGSALAVLAWRLIPTHREFIAGLIAGMTWTVVVSVRDEPPEAIARWRRGAEGERATGKVLRPLERKGWRVFHDLAARRGNVDHVVVGPGGLFLLETKNLSGRLVVEDGVLNVRFDKSPLNDYALTNLGRGIGGTASRLERHLAHCIGWVVDVLPVVVLASVRFEQGVVDGRVTYVAVDRLAKWLEGQPRRISDADVATVAGALSALPPAGEIPFEREATAVPK